MQTTYRIRANEVNINFIEVIKKTFKEDDFLTITVASEKGNDQFANEEILKFLELEKKYPPKRVSKDLDFNSIVDEVNL